MQLGENGNEMRINNEQQGSEKMYSLKQIFRMDNVELGKKIFIQENNSND